MPGKRLILGTRGSGLALAQANQARDMLRKAHPDLEIEIRIIKTTGDLMPKASLVRGETKGLFTRELEQALLRKKIDVAIHSLKDLPTLLPAGLALSAIPERADPRDVVIAKTHEALRKPSLVFTSSPRRSFQAKTLWKDCEIREIRGNVETRLEKLASEKMNAGLLLAAAGLYRLGFLPSQWEEGELKKFGIHHRQGGIGNSELKMENSETLVYRKLPISEMLPAPGQAALGLETRADDGIVQERLRPLHHFRTWSAVAAERAFLQGLGGGCAVPVAAHADSFGGNLILTGLVFDQEGKAWRDEARGSPREPEIVGQSLAQKFLNQGKRVRI